MKHSNRVRPTLIEQPMIGRSRLRSEQRIVYPTFGFVDVYVCGNHVVIAGENDRGISPHKLIGTQCQPLEPPQLVVELGSRCRIAVWKIQTSDNESANACFNIAAVEVSERARHPAVRFDWITSAHNDRHA